MEVQMKECEEPQHPAGDQEPLLAAASAPAAAPHVATNAKQPTLKNGFHEPHTTSSYPKEAASADPPHDDAPLLADSQQPDDSATKNEDDLRELHAKYAPYARRDSYGTLGLGPMPVIEKIMLGLAVVTIVPLKLVLLFLILLAYYIICRCCTFASATAAADGSEGCREARESYVHISGVRREIIVRSGRFLARSLLFVLGFYWIGESQRDHEVMRQLQLGLGDRDSDQANEETSSTRQTPGAIVSNHVSYLDILYHMSASFPSFVAKRSVAKLPFVGLISKCMGCIYVQRESKSSEFKGVSGEVTERLKEASSEKAPSMLLFPEGTTTNGDYLLPFKTGAFLSPTPISPVILKYSYRRFSPAWDTISGTRHLLLLLCQLVNFLEVVRLPVYYPSAAEKSDPKLYASNVRTLMAVEGCLTLSNMGLPEKRVYHAALQELFFPQGEAQNNE